tara:strand:- start:95 stop:238 length:144 start_codon:yes stop_codon:yes gene_type:complete
MESLYQMQRSKGEKQGQKIPVGQALPIHMHASAGRAGLISRKEAYVH